MVNWVDMVVLDSNNKRGHVFEAWIRLMPNEFETYTFFCLVDTLVLIRVSLQAANCAWHWLKIKLYKENTYQGTFSPNAS